MAASSLKVIEETFKGLTSLPGVLGVLVCTTDGIPIRSTLDPQLAVQYVALTLNVSSVSRRAVKQLSHATYGEVQQQEEQRKADAGAQPEELQHIRLRTAKHEIMIVIPDAEPDGYIMVVVHETNTKAA